MSAVAREGPAVHQRRVVVFRPVIRVELGLVSGVGAEEATTVAVASWSAALSGTDELGDPAAATWWSQDLHEIADVISVELQGASWAATYGTDA